MSAPITAPRENQVPLCVDLDGTLIKTDLLWESFVCLLRKNPLWLFVALFWWMRGRAFLKQQVAARVTLDVATLPYNEPFLEFLREAKRQGRRLILATASDRKIVAPVAAHVGLFDEVFASDGKTNLRAAAKLKTLTERFGERGFDYAGNSSVDLAVWKGTREALVVNAGDSLASRASQTTRLGRCFPATSSKLVSLVRCLRPHQWVKNFIVFVPLLTSHHLLDRTMLVSAVWAFIAFSLCASGMYVLNDLMDLDADRHHAAKRARPLASGDLPLSVGLALVPLLLAAAAVISFRLSGMFPLVLALYLAMTTAYSWHLKRVPLMDVFVLAGLYTSRLIAGHVVTGIAYSAWLLVFSMFIFLSLALMKRFQELQSLRRQNEQEIKGRGYIAGDLELVTTLGLVSGFIAVLVLALYVNSEQVVKLYAHPTRLLLVCPLMLYWISRVWFLAHRGQMHDDPTVFACKDWASYLIAAMTLVVMWLATGH